MYLETKINAVAEVNSFQAATMVFVMHISGGIAPGPASVIGPGQGEYALVGNSRALHQTYPLELRQGGQKSYGFVGQMRAASQVDISDAVAGLDQSLYTFVRDVPAMTQVEEV